MSKSPESADSSADMVMKVESGDDLLIATVFGPVSVRRILELLKDICDTALARGYPKILIDCLGVTGELSIRERHAVGKDVSEYVRTNQMSLKIALLGEQPVMNGVGVAIAQNRGLNVELFYDRQRALAWLQT